MESLGKGALLVGVTAAGENSAALRFALDDARRTGREVTLVHAAWRGPPVPPPGVRLADADVNVVGQQQADDAHEELNRLSNGDISARTVVRRGQPVNVLVDLSTDASLVVLQRRSLSKLHRLFTGSTVLGVAAHAHCPVVSVPSAWSPPATAQPVTVGVHGRGAPQALLDVAFDEAKARETPLRFLHAWRVADAYIDLVGANIDTWITHTRELLHSELDESSKRHPEVDVEVEVRYQRPVEALVESAARSSLVIVGRHGQDARLPHTVGSLARTLVAQAACPVMVVPLPRG
jgi:nucleotide-binding universal stress UspA family protein